MAWKMKLCGKRNTSKKKSCMNAMNTESWLQSEWFLLGLMYLKRTQQTLHEFWVENQYFTITLSWNGSLNIGKKERENTQIYHFCRWRLRLSFAITCYLLNSVDFYFGCAPNLRYKCIFSHGTVWILHSDAIQCYLTIDLNGKWTS